MNRAVAFLKALGSTLARPTFMKYFNTERALNRRAPEYPNSMKPDIAIGEAEYNLSFANYQKTWETFKKVHNRQYATEEEERKRFSIFMENVKLIENHNWQYHNGDSTFCLGINLFTDLTTEESRRLTGFRVNRTRLRMPRLPPKNRKCSRVSRLENQRLRYSC